METVTKPSLRKVPTVAFLALTVTSALSADSRTSWSPLTNQGLTQEVQIDESGPAGLVAQGWTQIGDELWRRATDPGLEEELAFGRTGLERAHGRLTRHIERLAAHENLSAGQELELHQLLVRREALEEELRNVSEKLVDSHVRRACYGNATFIHTYRYLDFVTPSVNSFTRYIEFGPVSPGYKAVFSEAKVCAGAICDHRTNAMPGYGSWHLVSSATASLSPYWSCTAEAYGFAFANPGISCPVGSSPFVSYSSSRSCYEF